MIDIDKIEAAANAATPGPWEAAGPSFGEQLPKYLNCVGAMDDDENFVDVCVSPFEEDECASADMAFIATANPTTVLEMVGMIRERDAVLKQALEALERWHSGNQKVTLHTRQARPSQRLRGF